MFVYAGSTIAFVMAALSMSPVITFANYHFNCRQCSKEQPRPCVESYIRYGEEPVRWYGMMFTMSSVTILNSPRSVCSLRFRPFSGSTLTTELPEVVPFLQNGFVATDRKAVSFVIVAASFLLPLLTPLSLRRTGGPQRLHLTAL